MNKLGIGQDQGAPKMGSVSVLIGLVVRTARAGLRGAGVDQADDPFHVVQGIGDTSSHRRGQTAKALVLTAEVVMDEVQRQHVEVVLQRSEESRVGKECVSRCRFRWSRYL